MLTIWSNKNRRFPGGGRERCAPRLMIVTEGDHLVGIVAPAGPEIDLAVRPAAIGDRRAPDCDSVRSRSDQTVTRGGMCISLAIFTFRRSRGSRDFP
jgi:hypothetical protein